MAGFKTYNVNFRVLSPMAISRTKSREMISFLTSGSVMFARTSLTFSSVRFINLYIQRGFHARLLNLIQVLLQDPNTVFQNSALCLLLLQHLPPPRVPAFWFRFENGVFRSARRFCLLPDAPEYTQVGYVLRSSPSPPFATNAPTPSILQSPQSWSLFPSECA